MGRSPCCDKNGLKKGPWTQEEDLKLIQYIQTHGPSNWRTLPKNAGLQRCGKSCRLRWINYLRPDIKRGRFSFEEEETIIQLHSVLGNKWSAIAARLPGRTDNEIKNYWNTHIRKRLIRNGIDPVTHSPRLDLLDLSSILNSAQFNLSNLLRLQTLVNPELLTLASLLASSNSSTSKETQGLFINNPINPNHQLFDQNHPMQANENHLSENFANLQFGRTSPENLITPCLTDKPITVPSYGDEPRAQALESSGFPASDAEKNLGSFKFSSVLSTPVSGPNSLLDSSSTLVNNSSAEDERESKMFDFEIPEGLEFDEFMCDWVL